MLKDRSTSLLLSIRILIIAGILLLGVGGCVSHRSAPHEITELDVSLDTTRVLSGDLILRGEQGLISDFCRKYGSVDHQYSHCGILQREIGQWYVYHSELDESWSLNGATKEPLGVFLRNASSWAVYNTQLTPDARKRLLDQAEYQYSCKTTFDTHLDTKDTTSLYCTEFVAHCFNQSNVREINPHTHVIFRDEKVFSLDDVRHGSVLAQVMPDGEWSNSLGNSSNTIGNLYIP